jgi:hypothetical protein
MAGYSGTPLAKKLGIAAETKVHLINEPSTFRADLEPLPPGVTFKPSLRGPLDVVVFFTTAQTELLRRWDKVTAAMMKAGAVWIGWPKKASKVPTDITEDELRRLLLPTGLVDVKVCAIDDTWSGLKFVLRKELR